MIWKNTVALFTSTLAIVFGVFNFSIHQSNITDLSKKRNLAESSLAQKDTKLYFSHFTVNLHDFNVHSSSEAWGNLVYYRDTSEIEVNVDERKIWSVVVKKDSVHLVEDNDSYFRNNLIEIIPKNRHDEFKVSYMFQVELKGSTGVKWQGATAYKPVKESAKYFFRVPKHAFYDHSADKEIKNRLKLRDTLIKYPSEDGQPDEYVTLIYHGTPCIFTANQICVRIQRFVRNKLTDTKFITVGFNYTG